MKMQTGSAKEDSAFEQRTEEASSSQYFQVSLLNRIIEAVSSYLYPLLCLFSFMVICRNNRT